MTDIQQGTPGKAKTEKKVPWKGFINHGNISKSEKKKKLVQLKKCIRNGQKIYKRQKG